MVKKLTWPWIIGALSIGWWMGSEPPVNQSSIGNTKADRITNRTVVTQPAPIVAKKPPTPLIIIPKKIKITDKAMFVDASRLNVRNQPSRNGKQVWTLKRDEKVTVTNKNGDWLYVQGKRYRGWVFGSYLTPKKSPATQTIVSLPVKRKTTLSTSKIKRILIERSLALYRGACPCPYNRTSRGNRCGKRSAYSRPGGASPLCYSRDISNSQVAAYRNRL